MPFLSNNKAKKGTKSVIYALFSPKNHKKGHSKALKTAHLLIAGRGVSQKLRGPFRSYFT